MWCSVKHIHSRMHGKHANQGWLWLQRTSVLLRCHKGPTLRRHQSSIAPLLKQPAGPLCIARGRQWLSRFPLMLFIRYPFIKRFSHQAVSQELPSSKSQIWGSKAQQQSALPPDCMYHQSPSMVLLFLQGTIVPLPTAYCSISCSAKCFCLPAYVQLCMCHFLALPSSVSNMTG